MLPIKVITLGCRLNQAESEAVIYSFKTAGFKIFSSAVKILEPAIIIVNTCTVTSKADQKTRRFIRKALSDNPEACVIAAGCYAQMDMAENIPMNENYAQRFFILRKDLSSAGEVKSALLKLPEYLLAAALNLGEKPTLKDLQKVIKKWIKSPFTASPFGFNAKEFSVHSRAFLKIQDGCNNCCSYCRIRLARGPSISLPLEESLGRLKALEDAGYAEVMLTGVNVTQYSHSGFDLAGLLDRLLKGSSYIALRLSSLEPDGITEKLASVLSHPRIQPHFHLSVQSGSDTILKTMNRIYSAAVIENGISLLRSVKENPFLACDIISGFPGETEEEFSRTIKFLEDNNFAWIHAFPYSKRPDTPAFGMKSGIIEREITKRVELLTKLALEGRRNYGQYWLGRQLSAIVEKGRCTEEGHPMAVSENYLKLVLHNAKSLQPGLRINCILETLCEGADGEKPDAAASVLLPYRQTLINNAIIKE